MDLETIKGFNPWWVNPEFRFSGKGLIKRDMLNELKNYLDVPQIISLIGLRRSGKTTILKFCINKLLARDVHKDRILYFSFEEYWGKNQPEVLEEVLNIYLQRYLQKDIWEIKDRHYILLDEIQYINHWQDILKRFYDKNNNLKFIISGFFSAIIRKKSTESLAGRIFEVIVPLFNFSEYCLLKGIPIRFPPISVKDLLNITPKKLDEIARIQQLHSSIINIYYEEYLYKGQFPEVSLFAEENLVNSYIKGSVLKKILTEDAPKIFKIDRPGEFSSIYKIISKESGNIFEILNLAQEVGINKDTLKNYLYYLEHMFVLKLVYNYTRKLRRQYRIQKKIYVTSPNFTCNELNINNNSPSFFLILGSLVETAVFQLLSLRYDEVFFWRQRDKEVDFIVEGKKGNILPFEVKYTDKILPPHLNNLYSFMEHNRLEKGVVVTKNKARIFSFKGRRILLVPIWSLI